MLSWSATKTNREVDLFAIADPSRDPLVPGGRALLKLVACSLGVDDDLAETRQVLSAELGTVATTRACAVVAAFEMFNRVADGIGIPVTRARRQKNARAIAELDLGTIAH